MDDESLPDLDRPGPSGAATRQLDFEPKKTKKGKNTKNSKKTFMESDEQFLNTVNECMSSLSSAVAPNYQKQEFIDTHQQWANLLASKIRRMHPVEAEKFKLEVDSKALELIIEFE